MAQTLYTECCRQARLIKQNTTYWIAVGKQTAWDDDNDPPTETRLDEFVEPIVYVKAWGVTLCKAVLSGGDITYKGQSYQSVADEDAITELARFLYLKAELHPAQGQPYGTYRQAAVIADIVPTVGHENDVWLAPANVQDPGLTVLIENDKPMIQTMERYVVLPMMLEFR